MTGSASDSLDVPTRPWDGAVPRASGAMPELPRRWAPVRLLGEGGQAEVWLAEDLELGEPVAVKVFRADLSPAARERLRREVRLGRALQHPGLVRIFELIEAGERLAIVMERVPGGSLADRVQSGPLPILEIVGIARQTLEALSALHAQHVLHRDIKPSNLLLDAQGRVKLADLGLARSLAEASDVTRTQTAVGTPAYMSPEQLAGRDPQPASDLFALGATLFELVTGQRPFAAPPDGGGDPRLTARAGSPRRQRPDCPRWLSSFILRLLEREPRDRFRDAARALAGFERRHLLVSPRLRRRIVAGGLAACLAAVGGVTLWNRSRATLSTATVSGSQVIAVDTRGRELWRRDFPGFDPDPLLADVVADPRPEVIVALHAPSQGIPEGIKDLHVLGPRGEELAAIASTFSQFGSEYPDLEPTADGPTVMPLDLDGDNRLDLVWIARHWRWYPTVVGVWNLRTGQPPAPLLLNSGHVQALATADVNGDGRLELVATGINNPLGFQTFVAVLPLDPRASGRLITGSSSPDLMHGGRTGASHQSPYTLLGAFEDSARVARADRLGIDIAMRGRVVHLDAAANPVSSRLYGRGGEARGRMWSELASVTLQLESRAAPWTTTLARLESQHPEALSERPMRVATSLLLARALARGGDHTGAADLLDLATRQVDDLDLWLRLGEQRAILGQLDPADLALERATNFSTTGRNPYDAVVARALLASLHGSATAFEKTRHFWEAWMGRTITSFETLDLQALWAFTQARWSDTALLEQRPPSTFPVVAVLRTWGAVARGLDPGRARSLAEPARRNPETAHVARLLIAHLDTITGAPERAATEAATVLAELDRRGRESFEIFAWVPLAERVLADALLAAGRPAEAATHLARARRLAPGAWFGAAATPPPRARRM